MKKCFISTYKGEWMSPANVLKKQLGYEIISLDGKYYPSISNKWVLLRKEIGNVFNIIKNLKRINHSEVIICSNYVCLFLIFLLKLRILKSETICWYGMYVHSPKWVKLLGKIIRLISVSPSTFRIVVFSKAEVNLYAQKWGIDSKGFIYIPYGDWNNSFSQKKVQEGEYFFSGGYSNRDYIPLIQIFTGRSEKLIIAASKQNTDLVEWMNNHTLSDNISVYYDIDNKNFDELLCSSKAVIFIMKHNTGASGQMVVLNAMANHKLIITTYTDVLNEYVKNNETAIVINKRDVQSLLPDIISKINRDKNAYRFMIDAAYEKYRTVFSYDAISKALVKSIREL